jgi:aspartate/glutamate racemase
MLPQPVVTIGIIGGIGPAVTILIQEKISVLLEAIVDTELCKSTRFIVDNNPTLNSFSAKGNVFGLFKKTIVNLKKLGAQLIVIPCNYADKFTDQLQYETGIEILSISKIVRDVILSTKSRNILVCSHSSTVKENIYHKVFQRNKVNLIYPNPTLQNQIDEIILFIKNRNNFYKNRKDDKIFSSLKKISNIPLAKKNKGSLDNKIEHLIFSIEQQISKDNIDSIILACTDLSFIHNHITKIPKTIFDSLELLACKTVAYIYKTIQK